MRRRFIWPAGAVALAIIVAAVVFFFVRPGGASSAETAVLDRVRERADAETARVLVTRSWGDGKLVLIAYTKDKERLLGLGFAAEHSRGWRVAAYTEENVALGDVVVGSLLVASSEGGSGQPPWSVAAGELGDPRIKQVEVRWASGQTSSAPRRNSAYLVVQEGTTTPLEARYLTSDGTEIAKVPVEP